jgi:hypothetical protein
VGTLTAQDDPHPDFPNRFARTYLLEDPAAGQPLSITGRSTAFDVFLQVLDQGDGAILFSSTADNGAGVNGEDEKINFTPSAGRSYLVRISSESDGATGAYEIGVFNPSLYAALPAVVVPSTTNGSLTTSSPLDPLYAPEPYYSRDYRLVGSAGMPLTATLTSSAIDSYLEIVNAETGLLVRDDDDSGGGLDSFLNFTPTSGVAYIIRVTTAIPSQTGSFRLSLAPTSPPNPAGTITVPATRAGSLLPTDDRDPNYPGSFKDDYVLTGVNPGRTVTVTMTSTQLDCFLFLINEATGAILDSDDDGGGGTNSRLVITVQAGVTYVIRATSYADGETGSYTLSTSG